MLKNPFPNLPKTRTKVLLLTLLFTLSALASQAQPSEMKFGEAEEAELLMTSYDPDPDAAAVILGEYGRVSFDTGLDGFEIVFQHHRRIKVLKPDGLDLANIEIPLYKGRTGAERMISFKAVALNAMGENSRITLKNMFVEDVTEKWKNAKFTLPKVEVGTVIDFEYKIQTSDFYSLRRWQFQHAIPTIASEFRVDIPEYFNYKVMLSGYEQMADFSQKDDTRIFHMATGQGSMAKLSARVRNFRYLMKDVPAFYPEPYMTCVKDNLAAIRFELASIQMPQRPERSIMSTWEELSEMFLNHKDVGQQMNRIRFLKSAGQQLKEAYPDPEERIAAAFEQVTQRMAWNGQIRYLCESSLQSAWDNRTGNSGEINMILRGLLDQADITAEPVLISTRAHGKIPKEVPFARNFNDLIVRVEVGKKAWLVDATDKSRPFNLLPTRCLNGDGLLLRKKGPGWVMLNNGEQYKTRTTGLVNIQPDGSLSGKIRISYAGLDAVDAREEVEEDGQEAYLKNIREIYSDWEIETLELKGMDQPRKKVEEVITFKATEAGNAHGKLIYLDPLSTFVDDENPFQREERKYPVDIGCSVVEDIILTFTIPEGYEIEEIPENMHLRLPENGGQFKYIVSSEANMIQLVSSLKLTGPVYHPDFYGALREFYGRVIEKQAEQFVLKKKS